MRLSLRTRFALAYVGMFAAISLVASLFVYAYMSRELLASIDNELVLRAALIRGEISKATEVPDGAHLSRLVDDFGSLPYFNEFYVALFDQSGALIAQSDTTRGAQLRLVRDFQDISLDDRPTTLRARALVEAGAGSGWVRGMRLRVSSGQYVLSLAVDLREYFQARWRLKKNLIYFGVAGLLVSSAVGFILSGPLAYRLRQVSDLARQVRPSDLSARFDSSGSDDELARLANALNLMLDRLEASHRRLERFAADASHELKTPLTALIAEFSLVDTTNPEQMGQLLGRSSREMKYLCRLVDALLLIARTDRPETRTMVSLDILIQQVTRRLQSFASDYSVSIRIQTADCAERAEVLGDAIMLDLMLEAILRHVISFAQSGEQVLVRCDGAAIVEIEANGPPLLFEKFAGLDRAAQDSEVTSVDHRRGTAIGLSISASIIARHGGTLHSEHNENRLRLKIDISADSSSSNSPVTQP